MSGIFGKKQVLLAVLVVALGVAVYLNYYFSGTEPAGRRRERLHLQLQKSGGRAVCKQRLHHYAADGWGKRRSRHNRATRTIISSRLV